MIYHMDNVVILEKILNCGINGENCQLTINGIDMNIFDFMDTHPFLTGFLAVIISFTILFVLAFISILIDKYINYKRQNEPNIDHLN